MEKYLVKTVNNIEADATGNIDGNSLGFIPLSGTEIGKPVTGDITIDAVNTGFLNIKNTTDGNGKFSSIQFADDYGVSLYSLNTDNSENFLSTYTDNPYILVSSSNASFRGLSGAQDYSANIRDLDYTQKIYVGYRGTATLSSGTVTVSTPNIKTGYKIYVSVNTPSGTQGVLSAPTGSIVNEASFVINSTSALDNSTVNWWIAP